MVFVSLFLLLLINVFLYREVGDYMCLSAVPKYVKGRHYWNETVNHENNIITLIQPIYFAFFVTRMKGKEKVKGPSVIGLHLRAVQGLDVSFMEGVRRSTIQ